MKYRMQSILRRATGLTRAGRLQEALAAIQAGLGFHLRAAQHDEPKWGDDVLNIEKEVRGQHVHVEHAPAEQRQLPVAPELQAPTQPSPIPIVEDVAFDSGPATFTDGVFEFNGRTHHYKLFVPGGATKTRRPMLVMLHGCTQDPDDFAVGTDMNNIARAAGWVVLYPAQSARANHTKCWNWFKAGPEPGAGEPAWIAALTMRLQDEQHVDPNRTFIAGLSAGAAMAMLTAELHPAMFKGVGVHSGLTAHAATNVMEALSVMKHGPRARQKRFYSTDIRASNPIIPLIVFHGDADKTVDCENGEHAIETAIAHAKVAEPGLIVNETENQGAAGGMSYTRVAYNGNANRPIAEYWRLHGAGHAWSGGNERGSHTNASGPNASSEFLRFFDAVARGHPRQ
jgi:poly(hydroxyalkanoate) depolymerase family esterase